MLGVPTVTFIALSSKMRQARFILALWIGSTYFVRVTEWSKKKRQQQHHHVVKQFAYLRYYRG